MAFAPSSEYDLNNVAGFFREKDHDNPFEYSKVSETPFEGYDRKVWVGPLQCEYRYAKILKTVAYIVVDEDATGGPVVEKWFLKDHRVYPA